MSDAPDTKGPAEILHGVSDEKVQDLALVENLQREDVAPMDRAEAILEYKERNNLKRTSAIGKRLNMSRQSVGNLLSLTTLPESVKAELLGSRDHSLRDPIPVSHLQSDEEKASAFDALRTGGPGRETGRTPSDRTVVGQARVAMGRLNAFSVEQLESNLPDVVAVMELAMQCIVRLAEMDRTASSCDEQTMRDAHAAPELCMEGRERHPAKSSPSSSRTSPSSMSQPTRPTAGRACRFSPRTTTHPSTRQETRASSETGIPSRPTPDLPGPGWHAGRAGAGRTATR